MELFKLEESVRQAVQALEVQSERLRAAGGSCSKYEFKMHDRRGYVQVTVADPRYPTETYEMSTSYVSAKDLTLSEHLNHLAEEIGKVTDGVTDEDDGAKTERKDWRDIPKKIENGVEIGQLRVAEFRERLESIGAVCGQVIEDDNDGNLVLSLEYTIDGKTYVVSTEGTTEPHTMYHRRWFILGSMLEKLPDSYTQ